MRQHNSNKYVSEFTGAIQTQVTEPDIPGYEEQTDTNPDSPVGVYQIYGDPRTYSARRPTYDHRHKGLRQHRHTDIGRDLRTNLFLKLLRNDGY